MASDIGRSGRIRAATLAAVSLLSVIGGHRAVAAESAPDQVRLVVEGRRSAFASVAGDGLFVATAWGATDAAGVTDVYVAVSRDGARSFGRPVRASGPVHPASLSGEQPARVTLRRSTGPEPEIIVLWVSITTRGSRLFTATSTDGGQSFGNERAVAGSEAPGSRGWASIAADANGRVSVAWLDHREAASVSHPGMEHSGKRDSRPAEDPTARAQLSALWVADLAGDGDTAPRLVAQGVCYCCKTALASGPDGSLHAAWRHVYPGSERDIAFATSQDGGRSFHEPLRVSRDGWAIDGCPEDGPSLATDAAGGVHIAWPTTISTTDGRTSALFYTSRSSSGSFGPRQRIPVDGVPRHPVLTVTRGGDLVAAWDVGHDGRRAVGWGGWPSRGGPGAIHRGTFALERGVYPTLAPVADGAVLAWTAGPPDASYVAVARIDIHGRQP